MLRLMAARSHLELIAAVLASFIGLLALGVSAYAAYWQRQAVRAQVWPSLQWSYSNVNGFAFMVENAGSGPAMVRSFEVTVDGEPMKDWHEVLRKLLGQNPSNAIFSDLNGHIVRAGAELKPLHLLDEDVAKKFAEQGGRINATICYCSVLDECWTIAKNHDAEAGPCAPVRKQFGD
jgi:hypothetical protein